MYLAAVPYNSFYFEWEIALEEWIQAVFPATLIEILQNLSLFGEELLLIVVMGFLYWGYNKEIGKFVGVNMLVVGVLNPMIKNVFIRRRPYFESEKIDLLRLIDTDADKYDIVAQGYSFPSGHSSSSATVYGSVARSFKKRIFTILAILLPLCVGISRIVVGAHYPTDVLCGWALGIFVIFFVPWLQQKIHNDTVFYLVLLIATLPGIFYCSSSDYFSGYGMLLGYCLADPFERRFVNFENTKSIPRCILRVIGGGAIYFALNTLLKLPFSADFLNSATPAAFAVRTIRYAIVVFVVIALYPALFRRDKKDK
ncbi:MAG: phosphatase PAP2 family protein [Lachnospiraceae bacterium]|nr:phosphatase PAP2 family protein [Lachnospiraceae bacterium]